MEQEHSTLKILVAEDNNINYLLIKNVLKEFELTRALNGLEAIEMAKNQKFNAIIMDVRMPIMDGIEAIKHIREFDTMICIITLTANTFDDDKKRALAAGANEFITKPFEKDQLVNLLHHYI